MATLSISVVLFTFIIFFPHRETFLALSNAGASGSVIFSFLGVVFSNNTIVSLSGAVLVSLLTGIYVPLFIAYIKKFGWHKTRLSGLGGSILGMLGIGCVACGSTILVPLLSVLGLGGFLAGLPFRGEEFLFMGILILLMSLYYLLKNMNKPMVCLTKPDKNYEK